LHNGRMARGSVGVVRVKGEKVSQFVTIIGEPV
jgi:hypothetical protein